MIELAEDTLGELVQSNKKVMVQFGASWCGNCRITKPKFKRLSGDYPDIQFVYVDAEKLPKSRLLTEVKNLPTFTGFVNGQVVASQASNKEETIKQIIDAVANN